MKKDELAQRLLVAFLAEVEERLRVLNADLLALEDDPTDADRIASVFRIAHSLKGAARAAGVPLVEQTCHAVEKLLSRVSSGEIGLSEEHFTLLFSVADALEDASVRIRNRQELADSPLAALQDQLAQEPMPGAALPHRADRSARVQTRPPPTKNASVSPAPASVPLVHAGATAEHPMAEDVRVPAAKLEALLATSSELLLALRRFTGRSGELRQLQRAARRRSGEIPGGLKSLSGPARERSGSLVSPGDSEEQWGKLRDDIRRITEQTLSDTRSLSLLAHQLGEDARRIRMRPFEEACEGLPRLVRDLAVMADKEIVIRIDGGDIEVGQAVLNALREAILHLVRNAVDHGIEPPGTRRAAGKPAYGTIDVRAALRGTHVAVVVSDDGAGLDLAGVREQMARRGSPIPSDDAELARSVFLGGLSTRQQVTMLSGRGVGLDIVRTTVERLGGTVHVETRAGQGTSFTVVCPLSLSSLRALIVGLGSQNIAIPVSEVTGLFRVRPGELRRAERHTLVDRQGGAIPIVSLARVFGLPEAEPAETQFVYAVQIDAGGRQLALAVDSLRSEEELVVGPLAASEAPAFVSGAALLPSGTVALVTNPHALIDLVFESPERVGYSVPITGRTERPSRRVLVVDDSITTRTLGQSILESAGYEVISAVDGAEGWRLLLEKGCDLVVSDVEMPRLNGFELTRQIRKSARFANLPVILVTALESPADRQQGLDAGADAYIGKSSFDQESLLDTVRQLID